MVRYPRIPLLALALVAMLLIPIASGVFAEEPPLKAVAADAAAKDAGCPVEWTEEQVLASTLYQDVFAHYEDEPGFVDLYFVHGVDRVLVALFDLEARGDAPLPAALEVSGAEVQVRGERFETLMATLSATQTPATLPVPLSCNGRISPGARVSTSVGGCSANFVFTDQNSRWYVGTAGHCFGNSQQCPNNLGARMSVGGLGQVGSLVFCVSGGIGADFALVLIDQDKEQFVNPSMCYWGGPTGTAVTTGGVIRHYGFPIIWGQNQLTRPRSGLGTGGGANSFEFAGIVASGDSGSGARQDGGAGLGIITHVNVPLLIFAHSGPFAFGTRLTRAMDLAEAATGLDLTLQTAPVAV